MDKLKRNNRIEIIGVLTVTALLWGGLVPAAIGMYHGHTLLTIVGWAMMGLAGIISHAWMTLGKNFRQS